MVYVYELRKNLYFAVLLINNFFFKCNHTPEMHYVVMIDQTVLLQFLNYFIKSLNSNFVYLTTHKCSEELYP